MYAVENDNRRYIVFLIISTLLHTLLLLLIPGFGLSPIGAMTGIGDAVEVTILPMEPVTISRPTAPQVEPSRSLVPVKTVQTPSQPRPTALPRAPVPVPRQEQPTVEDSLPQQIVTAPTSPQEVPEVSTTPTVEETPTESEPETTTEETEEAEAEPEPEPLSPPLVREAVSGFGLLRHYPAKEAALLVDTLVARVEVTVTTEGKAVNPILLTPSVNEYLDFWVTQTAARQLQFAPAQSPYQVTIEVLVDPQNKRVTLTPEGERVRFVQP
ncbi:MAG: hypothetical protein ACOYEP_01365 [Limnochordia bacterium]